MKSNNLLDIVKNQNIVIPYVLLKNKEELGIDFKELVFLSFLMQYGDKVILDVEKFSKKISIPVSIVMSLIGTLSEKKLIAMEVSKNSAGMMVEYLDLNVLYTKLVSFLIDLKKDDVIKDQKEIKKSNIYEVIEKEFGRTLSPIEYETIKGWLDSNINEELIKEALKEAILNGVTNLKYIDKILYEWNRKGYTKANDIKRKTKQEDKNSEIDIIDYDWLNDND